MEVLNQYDNIVRANQNGWTTKRWKETYDFLKQGSNMASQTNKFMSGQFQNLENLKDKWADAWLNGPLFLSQHVFSIPLCLTSQAVFDL